MWLFNSHKKLSNINIRSSWSRFEHCSESLVYPLGSHTCSLFAPFHMDSWQKLCTIKRGYFEHFWTLRYDIIYVRTNIRSVHGLVTKESYAFMGPLWFLCRYFLFQWYFSSKCDCSKLPHKSDNIEHPGVTLNNTVLIVIWYIYTHNL